MIAGMVCEPCRFYAASAAGHTVVVNSLVDVAVPLRWRSVLLRCITVNAAERA